MRPPDLDLRETARQSGFGQLVAYTEHLEEMLRKCRTRFENSGGEWCAKMVGQIGDLLDGVEEVAEEIGQDPETVTCRFCGYVDDAEYEGGDCVKCVSLQAYRLTKKPDVGRRLMMLIDEYRRGWVVGAAHTNTKDISTVDELRGYEDGRQAFRDAMEAERKRLGMPPGQMLHLSDAGNPAAPKEDAP